MVRLVVQKLVKLDAQAQQAEQPVVPQPLAHHIERVHQLLAAGSVKRAEVFQPFAKRSFSMRVSESGYSAIAASSTFASVSPRAVSRSVGV
jgi:hypothetical protein